MKPTAGSVSGAVRCLQPHAHEDVSAVSATSLARLDQVCGPAATTALIKLRLCQERGQGLHVRDLAMRRKVTLWRYTAAGMGAGGTSSEEVVELWRSLAWRQW